MKNFLKIFLVFISLFTALSVRADVVNSDFHTASQSIYTKYNFNENSILKPDNSESLTSVIKVQTDENGNSFSKSYTGNKLLINYSQKEADFSFNNNAVISNYPNTEICTRAP